MKFTGALLVIAGLATVKSNMIASTVLFVLPVIVFSTYYGLRIDSKKGEYHDYVWFLGLRFGEIKRFDQIQCVFIKKMKVSQKMQLRAVSSTVHSDVFDAYIKFSEKDKVHLMTADDKQSLMPLVRKISSTLNIPVVDHTGNHPVEI